MGKSRLSLSDAIKHCEEVALQKDTEAEEHNPRYTGLIRECYECAAEHRQLAEWLKILKSAKFEYDEAWLTITHPTPDVTYADKQMAQVILDKFRNSLGAISALQTQDVNDKNTEDTISRRNVIDELKRYFHDEYYQRTSIQDCINCFIEDILTKLPSAQQEIIRCKDCKHHWTYRPMGNMPTETCEFEQTFYDANVDFCSLAERRTDDIV